MLFLFLMGMALLVFTLKRQEGVCLRFDVLAFMLRLQEGVSRLLVVLLRRVQGRGGFGARRARSRARVAGGRVLPLGEIGSCLLFGLLLPGVDWWDFGCAFLLLGVLSLCFNFGCAFLLLGVVSLHFVLVRQPAPVVVAA